VDEDCESRHLLALLRRDGHDVVGARESGHSGGSDETVLSTASEGHRALLTRNAADLLDLHAKGTQHGGILVIYQERDPAKSMTASEIAAAVLRVERAGFDIAGQFVVLNAWRG